MPISKENMKLYPGGSIKSPEWLAIRERIRKRAGNCCEECGVENHALGGRHSNGTFRKALPVGEKLLRLEWPRPGDWARCEGGSTLRIIRIVCTIAHIDGGLTDHSDKNLAFWCQQCHLRHDAAQHAKNAAATSRAKKASGDLLTNPVDNPR